MRAYIIEDEPHAQRALQQLVSLVAPDVQITGVAKSVEEGIELLEQEIPDFIFLDIKLGKRSGFDLLAHFPKPEFSILFVTAYNEFAIEAFKWNAIHYITKPIDSEELKEAIQRVRDHRLFIHPLQIEGLLKHSMNQPKNPEHIILKYDTIVDRQALKDIIRLEADGPVTSIYCVEKDFASSDQNIKRKLITTNIGYFERMLTNDFFRCHQSHIVNRRFVRHYNRSDNSLLLITDHNVPVSRRGKEGITEWLQE